jgi:hypothetical protein
VFPSAPRAESRRLGPRLSQPRAPRKAHSEGATPTARGRLHPPRSPPLQRMKSRGFGVRGLASPATFRPRRFSRPRRLAPRDPARAYFIPVTLLGFRLQGLAPLRGAVPLSRPRALVPFASRPSAFRRPAGARSSEHFSPRRVRFASDRNPLATVALLAFSPLRHSLPPRWDRRAPRPHALAGTAMERPDPSSPALAPGDRVAPMPGRRYGVFPGGGLGISSLSASSPAFASATH